jgi:anti-sigma regulatory factor (Ser/Thr protein kinase)
MTNTIQIRYELRAKLPATFAAVEVFIHDFRRGLYFLSGKEQFESELLVREALNNAVLHGSKLKATFRIVCVLRMTRTQLLFSVMDEGEGFAWSSALGREAADEASSGRGLEIYRKYANRFRFNKKGNRVTIFKRFKESSWQIQ